MELFEVFNNGKYKCEFEVKETFLFLHVQVNGTLSKSDIREARVAFESIKEEAVNLGYERMFSFTPSPHFARLTAKDFIHVMSIDNDGQQMELIVWELK